MLHRPALPRTEPPMRPIHAALAATALLVLPGASQSPAERIARPCDIPVEEWTAMAMGRTLTYRINGAFWAFEHYYPGTDRVTLQLYDGSCMEGRWDYAGRSTASTGRGRTRPASATPGSATRS